MSELAQGRCMCGGVQYAARGRLRDVVNCHCERCRQFSGHHLAATSMRRHDVDIRDGEDLLRWYSPVPEVAYGFCSRCGSSLFWRETGTGESMSICAGTLAVPTGLRTTQAWWVSQASDYHSRPDLQEHETE